jgi:pantoate ligase / CMP/dCMP kinase
VSTPVFNTPATINTFLTAQRHARIGLVPTMGALHIGHRRLIDRSIADNDITIVSIFVNPLQFAPHEDFDRYPRQLEIDRQFCTAAKVDAIFAPQADVMGINSVMTQVLPSHSMIGGLCGRSRLGHFQGVATIVTKLLNIIRPDRAYFGEKDAQQLAIIHRLVEDLNIPVEIIDCPTVREDSGLAYSSRNQYLSAPEKEQATVIYRSLTLAAAEYDRGQTDATAILELVKTELATVPALEIEYVELVDKISLQPLAKINRPALLAIAGKLGTTRLIDNLTINPSP